jgi:hypothetical protein
MNDTDSFTQKICSRIASDSVAIWEGQEATNSSSQPIRTGTGPLLAVILTLTTDVTVGKLTTMYRRRRFGDEDALF